MTPHKVEVKPLALDVLQVLVNGRRAALMASHRDAPIQWHSSRATRVRLTPKERIAVAEEVRRQHNALVDQVENDAQKLRELEEPSGAGETSDTGGGGSEASEGGDA